MAAKYRGVRGEITRTCATRSVRAFVSEAGQRTHVIKAAVAATKPGKESLELVKKLQQEKEAAAGKVPFQEFSSSAEPLSEGGGRMMMTMTTTTCLKNVAAFDPDSSITEQARRCNFSSLQDRPPRSARKMLPQKPSWSYSTKSPAAPLRIVQDSPVLSIRSRLLTRDLKPLERTPTTLKTRRNSSSSSRSLHSPVRISLSPATILQTPRGKNFAQQDKKGTMEIKGRIIITPNSKAARKKKPWEWSPPKQGEQRSTGKAEAKLSKIQKEILKKIAGGGGPMGAKQTLRKKEGASRAMRSSIDLSVAGRRARRLSQVLRSENAVLEQNQQYLKELQQLREQIAQKDQEVERLTSAGMLFKQLCTTQGEELKALKEAFPALLKEMSELRDTHGKQERESDTAQRVVTLQDEISSLQGKIECLTADLKQARPVSSKLAERLDKTERFSCQSGRRLNHSSEADIVPAAAAQPFRWRENKLATMLASDGKLTQQLHMTAIPEQAALREWCGNSLQESASSNGGPLFDAFKIRVASILRTASQGSQN
ncbi:unnamed protein product [Sphagnum troendelagicum]|uniref:Uncharacterized protein n=1 Tax=Sphagnum troendelagicum TaxID=128251 RepID=A0ABP0T8L4_9BRYO